MKKTNVIIKKIGPLDTEFRAGRAVAYGRYNGPDDYAVLHGPTQADVDAVSAALSNDQPTGPLADSAALRHAITAAGISRHDLAARIGCSPATIAAWCCGARKPNAVAKKILTEVLHPYLNAD